MITITIYGLDQYTIGHYSYDHTDNLAQLFEAKEEDINFVAPNNYVFHKGVEQTSWNAIVLVEAPEKYEVLEEKVAKYLIQTLKEFSINLTISFSYHHSHHEYNHVNKDYPRYIKDENLVNIEESEDGDELYEGNIFAGMEEQLEEAYRNVEAKVRANDLAEEEHCCCDDHCSCEDDDCCCGEHDHDHECCCGHHVKH